MQNEKLQLRSNTLRNRIISAMPFVLSFSFNSATMKPIYIEKTPYNLLDNDTIVEIDLDKEKKAYMIASNKEMLRNNSKVFFSEIKDNDIIVCGSSLFVICDTDHKDKDGKKCYFVGIIKNKNSNALMFKAPSKIYKSFFNEIYKIFTCYTYISSQLIIDCKNISYMDNDSIESMISLLTDSRNKKYSVYFYSPSTKFDSYLKLSNITKLTRIIKQNSGFEQKYNYLSCPAPSYRFFLRSKYARYEVIPNMINYVGRSDNLCSVFLHDDTISRVHAAIFILQNLIYILDCGSTNGTFINNKRIVPFTLCLLRIHDTVFFGDSIEFSVEVNIDISEDITAMGRSGFLTASANNQT